MKEFKSYIWNGLFTFFILTIPISAIVFLTLFLTLHIKLTQIDLPSWVFITLIYSFLSYFYAGLTNNNIVVYDDKLEIVNKIPLFKKKVTFEYDKINLVTFRHEWTQTFGRKIKPKILKTIIKDWIVSFVFPWDYKWIKVKTDKEHKFLCFGLSMDYYDNDQIVFEDLFYELAQKGLKVEWTNTTEPYYKEMTFDIQQFQKHN
jgi:hypothetical protein